MNETKIKFSILQKNVLTRFPDCRLQTVGRILFDNRTPGAGNGSELTTVFGRARSTDDVRDDPSGLPVSPHFSFLEALGKATFALFTRSVCQRSISRQAFPLPRPDPWNTAGIKNRGNFVTQKNIYIYTRWLRDGGRPEKKPSIPHCFDAGENFFFSMSTLTTAGFVRRISQFSLMHADLEE